jgi:hypothetical protein
LLETTSIAFPILSKEFANSQNCLNELSKMMELRKKKNLFILPIKVRNEDFNLPEDISAINYARLWEYPDISTLVDKLIESYLNIRQNPSI